MVTDGVSDLPFAWQKNLFYIIQLVRSNGDSVYVDVYNELDRNSNTPVTHLLDLSTVFCIDDVHSLLDDYSYLGNGILVVYIEMIRNESRSIYTIWKKDQHGHHVDLNVLRSYQYTVVGHRR